MAYKLQLPASSHIHPMVHVSQLKKAFGATVPVSDDLPPNNSILQAEHVPELVLDRKMVRVAGDIRPRIQVQGSHLPPSLPTWEDPLALQQRFPSTPPWGQVGTQAGGMSRLARLPHLPRWPHWAARQPSHDQTGLTKSRRMEEGCLVGPHSQDALRECGLRAVGITRRG